MAKHSGGALLSTLDLEPAHATPLYRQLEAAIRQMVLDGRLPPNSRLPATRQLSDDLGVSRLTVKNVYEQLTSEGFLRSRQGAGTYVADIPTAELPVDLPAEQSLSRSKRGGDATADRGFCHHQIHDTAR